MLVPVHRLLKSIRSELAEFFSMELADASAGQSVTAALKLLEVRELGGATFLHRRLDALEQLLAHLVDIGVPGTGWPQEVERLRSAVLEARRGVCLEDLEAAWRRLLNAAENLLVKLVEVPSIPASVRTKLAVTLGAWENADRRSLTMVSDDGIAELDTRITQERIERYLRSRFNESTLVVIKFQPLPGGFGKQTFLLEVDGDAVSGSLVLRRDPERQIFDNDCHRVRYEYPVIRAAHERGLPAPDALWLDTEHQLLPGGDFIIMRRAPGQTGGTVFGAKTGYSDSLVRVLADGIARLHTLPPCLELGDLTNSIRVDGWNLPLRECIYRYIREWYELYLGNVHNPSPALVSVYAWLFDNIPDSPGRPGLLHGDIGFHNMLVDEGRLSVLVDWEFAHIGDPAEDVAYLRNTSASIPWQEFISYYRAAGGPDIDPVRLHFFQVWGQARNAAASSLAMGKFELGAIQDLKLTYTGHYHFPQVLQAACDLIEAGPGGMTKVAGA